MALVVTFGHTLVSTNEDALPAHIIALGAISLIFFISLVVTFDVILVPSS
jgi:hypothetical protein